MCSTLRIISINLGMILPMSKAKCPKNKPLLPPKFFFLNPSIPNCLVPRPRALNMGHIPCPSCHVPVTWVGSVSGISQPVWGCLGWHMAVKINSDNWQWLTVTLANKNSTHSHLQYFNLKFLPKSFKYIIGRKPTLLKRLWVHTYNFPDLQRAVSPLKYRPFSKTWWIK